MSIKEHPPQSSVSKEHRSIETERLHVPVLLEASINVLKPRAGESYLDLTAGYGGHARAFLAKTKAFKNAVLVDRDENAIKSLSEFTKNGVTLMHTDFVSAAKQLINKGIQFDIVFADLGVSSPQLDLSERGFSFTKSGPLDMRMDSRQTVSAETLVNNSTLEDLIAIITNYGEEPYKIAKRIAESIVNNRPISSTGQLASLILSTQRGKWNKIHPATRTFQAIRIAVNDELRLIEDLLPLIPSLLKNGGRVGVISFHSLEDRLIKRFFKEQAVSGYEAELDIITKKPIDGSKYDAQNPRARSAKLRAAVKK